MVEVDRVSDCGVGVSQIAAVLRSEYNLEPENITELDGYWDLNYRVTTQDGDRFVKLYTRDSPETAAFHIDLIRSCRAEGIPTACVHTTQVGASLFNINGHPGLVQDFLPYKDLAEVPAGTRLVRAAGAALGQIHRMTKGRSFHGQEWKQSSWDGRLK